MAPPDNKIELEIVTPHKRALAAQVDEVTAPSVDGEFGVLPGHVPLLAAIQTGIVTYRQGADTKKCAVGPGFAEVGANKLLILTDEFIEREQVDPVLVRKQLAEVQGELDRTEPRPSRPVGGAIAEPLVKRERWLAAQLELYGDPPPATLRPHEEWGPPPARDELDAPTDASGESPGDSGPIGTGGQG
jgi:F-type H+-transporting ATPase subunit epsilon